MTTAGTRGGMGWGARILIALALILAGAAAATWGLARSDTAARLLGVAEAPTGTTTRAWTSGSTDPRVAQNTADPDTLDAAEREGQRIEQIEQRLARVENATQRAAGSVGRADSLLIAVAARRAIDRGVALGFLERLLIDRFGGAHQRAIATIVTGARDPVLLNELIAEFEALGPELRRGGSDEGWWTGFKREFGSIVTVHSAKRPAPTPDARFERALRRLQAGDVDQALAETMRMPGASNAQAWIAEARRYIVVHRALDEIESAALMPPQAA
ncbi:MAG: hypothetical protein ABIS39_02975 [Sphingomicrobium sp.]